MWALPSGVPSSAGYRALQATVWDEFTVAHLIGWWAKAVILRDRRMLWLLSTAFELCEVRDCTLMRTCTRVQVRTCTRAQVHTCTHAQVYTCTHPQMHICTPSHINMCTSMRGRMCTHAHGVCCCSRYSVPLCVASMAVPNW